MVAVPSFSWLCVQAMADSFVHLVQKKCCHAVGVAEKQQPLRIAGCYGSVCSNIYGFSGLTSSRESGTIMFVDGTWRSLVARFLGVEEVASSNLAVPTTI